MKKAKLLITNLDYQIGNLADQTDQKILATWAADCAERVLSLFEENFSEDQRPRLAIDAARGWVKGDVKRSVARRAAFAAHTAARAAKDIEKSCLAARAAAHAAATVHVPEHAIHAAIYAVTAINSAKILKVAIAEREWQYHHLQDLQMNDEVRMMN